jgi:hypothetical protein
MIRICHLLCPSINEYDPASLNTQVAQQSDQVARVDFETRTKSPVVHHRSIAHASAAIADCRNAALAEGIVSAFQAATDLHAPTMMVIATLRGSIWRGHRSIAHAPPGSAESADCRSLALGEGIVSAIQATTDLHAPSTMVSVALRESPWRGH